LGNGRVDHVRRRRQIGDADRPGSSNAEQQAKPGRITHQIEPLGPLVDDLGRSKRINSPADSLVVKHPAVSTIGGDEVHGAMMPQHTDTYALAQI
jgi:hypothetical protein